MATCSSSTPPDMPSGRPEPVTRRRHPTTPAILSGADHRYTTGSGPEPVVSVLVGFRHGDPGQPGFDEAGEVRALADILVPAGQTVCDRGACGLCLGDRLVQLGEFAL